MSPAIRNLLLVLASAVLLSVLVFVFRPHDRLDDAGLGEKIIARVLSIEILPIVNHRTEPEIAKLSIQLGSGVTASAVGLGRHVADCSVGDSVAVRLLPAERSDGRLYRVISKSCTRADW